MKTINATHETIAFKFSKFRNEIETPFPNRPINLISSPHTFPGSLVGTTKREGFMRANLAERQTWSFYRLVFLDTERHSH